MSRAQRLSFLAVAVVIAVVAAIVLTAGGDAEETASTGAQATPTATPEPAEPSAAETPTPEPTATPKPQPPVIGAGEVTRLRFEQGETIRFRVRSEVPEEIHVHGYDVTQEIEPGKTADVSFPAEITGIFEIELHGTGEQIAQLRVDPG